MGDTLRGQPHLAVPANIQQRSGVMQINHLVALLCAQRVPVDLDALYERRHPQTVDLASIKGGWLAKTNGQYETGLWLGTG